MKFGHQSAGVVLACLLFAGPALAQEPPALAEPDAPRGFDLVLFTPHNVMAGGSSALNDTVCASCHTEGKETEVTPAWDEANPTRTFTIQHFTRPPLGKGTPENKPFGPSYDCLTCHDGVLGNNVHQLGFSGAGPSGKPKDVEAVLSGWRTADHPESVTYPRQPDGKMYSDRPDPKLKRYWSIPDRDGGGILLPTGPRSDALNLQSIDPNDPVAASTLVRTFMGVIHCDTCHNPHTNEFRPFLRVPNKTLCLVCHDR